MIPLLALKQTNRGANTDTNFLWKALVWGGGRCLMNERLSKDWKWIREVDGLDFLTRQTGFVLQSPQQQTEAGLRLNIGMKFKYFSLQTSTKLLKLYCCLLLLHKLSDQLKGKSQDERQQEFTSGSFFVLNARFFKPKAHWNLTRLLWQNLCLKVKPWINFCNFLFFPGRILISVSGFFSFFFRI